MKKTALLLVNLGTPDAPTYWAVRRYLKQFLSDRRIVDMPRWLWWPLLNFVILSLRPFRTAAKYRRIWTQGGSPLALFSQSLSHAVASRVGQEPSLDCRVVLGMSYGRPGVAAAVEQLCRERIERLLILPLYPQYSSSTTASVFDAVARALRRERTLPDLRFVNRYWDRSAYPRLLADSIRDHWQANGAQRHLIFSFHGIPKRLMDQGDPYVKEALATAEAAARALGLSETEYSIGFQSRFGPARWVEPYTDRVLAELGARGVRRVSVVCPAFAVDCLETLEEVGLELKQGFASSGGDLDLIPALNDRPAHAEFLAGIAIDEFRAWG